MGKPVCVDIDDAYHYLPISNPAHRFWFENKFTTPEGGEEVGGAIRMMEQGFKFSDGLIAPNRLLLGDWAYASGNSYLVRNYAEPEWWGVETPLPPRAEVKAKWGMDNKVVIGWGGSVSHYDSFWGSGIMQAMPRITARHPEVVWVVCGGDDRLYEQLPVARIYKHHQPGVPPQDWPKIVRGFDIGIAPLFGSYDQRRSWIKAMEYSLAGVPYAATQGETYRDALGWPVGWQGLETCEFWEDTIETMLKDLPRYQEQANVLIPTAQQKFIVDNNLAEFSAVYAQIIADRQGSTRQPILPNVVRVEAQNG